MFKKNTYFNFWFSKCLKKYDNYLLNWSLIFRCDIGSTVGRRLANSCGCKFIETSSGLAHHVDELLVGILAQIKLNPQRDRDQATRRRRRKHRRRILKHLLGFKRKTKSCENLFVL